MRLFEGAKTAEERRMHRTGRRRLDRRGWRINILQELFAEEVSKIDPGFFLRMKESKYYPEDKRDINGKRPELPYALFVDPEFTDKDYHREFPTIYHLRKWLMGTKEVPDIRLVYLALHHMMKHRGHFLLSGDIEQVKELDNLSDRIPMIAENKEKLIQLFTFRIPYYVGPLNKVKEENEQKYTWAVRKSEDKIYPWNFTDIIDVEASAEKFIKRMTNKCTYLIGEDVLPKDSLLYSKYRVLNELNNVRLDGKEISVELKQKIYEGVFCKRRKVRQKDLKNFLLREGIAERDVDITGIDGDFKASLTAYHDFKEKLSGIDLKQSKKEELIQNIVLFGDDKKLLKQRLGKLFPKLTDKQKSSIAALSYHGWGRFSKKFLEEITIPAPETGEVWNLITALWETNENLSQLLGKKYQFSNQIKEYNEEQNNPTLSYKAVEEQYVSPAVKRQIWQTLQVIKEIKKVMGKEPERIFVEMARESQESKRTESRKKHLMDLYKVCKEEEKEIYEKLEKHEEQHLRKDKLFLYYTQRGHCMYSGEKMHI